MQDPNLRLQLVSQEQINASVRLFSFKLMDDRELIFVPGQFLSIQLVLEDGKTIRRSYSIASVGNRIRCVEFAITLIPNGAATQALCKLKPDDVVSATGPRGRFTFRGEIPGRHIMIGTGTGIVPYRSMLWQVELFLQQNPSNACIVLEGVRTREDVLFKKDFMKLCAYENFQFTACLSREAPTIVLEKPHETIGHVQDMLSTIKLQATTDTIYLCGNPYMIEGVKAILQESNFPQEKIVTEQYFAKKATPLPSSPFS